MTAVKKYFLINYLTFDDVRNMYETLFLRFSQIDEPIPPWIEVNKRNVEHLVEIPQTSFFGTDQYKTLESKGAIMLYKINKGHIFPNGNKRMSFACLVLFLSRNQKRLDVTPDEATRKALELAQSDARDHAAVLAGLERWIGDHMKNL